MRRYQMLFVRACAYAYDVRCRGECTWWKRYERLESLSIHCCQALQVASLLIPPVFTLKSPNLSSHIIGISPRFLSLPLAGDAHHL